MPHSAGVCLHLPRTPALHRTFLSDFCWIHWIWKIFQFPCAIFLPPNVEAAKRYYVFHHIICPPRRPANAVCYSIKLCCAFVCVAQLNGIGIVAHLPYVAPIRTQLPSAQLSSAHSKWHCGRPLPQNVNRLSTANSMNESFRFTLLCVQFLFVFLLFTDSPDFAVFIFATFRIFVVISFSMIVGLFS